MPSTSVDNCGLWQPSVIPGVRDEPDDNREDCSISRGVALRQTDVVTPCMGEVRRAPRNGGCAEDRVNVFDRNRVTHYATCPLSAGDLMELHTQHVQDLWASAT
jgi:hypothetical protein